MTGSFYTYFHTRNDTNAVFYIGKGQDKTRRAYDCNRNKHWVNIVNKCGHTVHIASKWKTEIEALEHEKLLITCFKDLGIPLTNITDGGEGWSGATHTQEFKEYMRGKMIGRVMSAETKKKMSVSAKLRSLTPEFITRNTGENNPMKRPEIAERSGAAQRGKKLTDEHKLKISVAGKGRMGANKGKTLSLEWRAKMSAAGKGRPKSEEHKIKIKVAHVARVTRLKAEKS